MKVITIEREEIEIAIGANDLILYLENPIN